MESKLKISIGNDHAGCKLKESLKTYLEEQGHEVIDEGAGPEQSTAAYPIYGQAVGRRVASGQADFGIAICGSGVGISIAANKIKGVRAALVSEASSAKLSRLHNDCNVVALGARLIGDLMAKEIVDSFLTTQYEGGRHQSRVDMLELED